jgi:hypothetical protein
LFFAVRAAHALGETSKTASLPIELFRRHHLETATARPELVSAPPNLRSDRRGSHARKARLRTPRVRSPARPTLHSTQAGYVQLRVETLALDPPVVCVIDINAQ